MQALKLSRDDGQFYKNERKCCDTSCSNSKKLAPSAICDMCSEKIILRRLSAPSKYIRMF